ncbi:MAG: membrane dipeptidase, partial [Candidatus Acidiferrales bacterium]
MKTQRLLTRTSLALALSVTLLGQSAGDGAVSERARSLHMRAIVVDTHSDTPQRMVFDKFDMGHRDADGHVDIPRMREGGLDAPFFSIWVSS